MHTEMYEKIISKVTVEIAPLPACRKLTVLVVCAIVGCRLVKQQLYLNMGLQADRWSFLDLQRQFHRPSVSNRMINSYRFWLRDVVLV